MVNDFFLAVKEIIDLHIAPKIFFLDSNITKESEYMSGYHPSLAVKRRQYDIPTFPPRQPYQYQDQDPL